MKEPGTDGRTVFEQVVDKTTQEQPGKRHGGSNKPRIFRGL